MSYLTPTWNVEEANLAARAIGNLCHQNGKHSLFYQKRKQKILKQHQNKNRGKSKIIYKSRDSQKNNKFITK